MTKLTLTLLFLIIACSAQASTTLNWWQFWTDPSIKPTIDSIVTEFEKQNPNIDVVLTDLTWANGHEKIVIALSSGTGPDIMELGSDWIAQFAENEHLADWAGHIESDSTDYHGWSLATYKNKIWAFPWFLGTRVLFANRDLLTRSGHDENFVPLTQLQLYESAVKIDSLGKDIYGWGSNTAEKHRLYKKFMPFFWTADAQLFSDDGRQCLLASSNAIKALEFYRKLHDSCGYVANQRGIEDAFLAGKVGYVISGDWLLKRIEQERPDFPLVSTFMPGERFPGKSFMGGEFLAINAASSHSEQARTFIRFLTSPENQVRFCRTNRSANPSSKHAQEDEYFKSNIHLQTFIKQLALAKHPPVDPDWVNMEKIIEEAVENALFEGKGAGEALYEARLKIDRLKRR